MKRRIGTKLQAYSSLAKAVIHQWKVDGEPLDFHPSMKDMYTEIINYAIDVEDHEQTQSVPLSLNKEES